MAHHRTSRSDAPRRRSAPGGPAPVVTPTTSLGVFRRPVSATGWRSWMFTVDHKKLGIMYGVSAMVFFVVGGIEALAIRAQLASADGKLLSADVYNQMFTMHATSMVFLFAMPMAAAFGNYFLPLQVGARDVAFPRINAFGFWSFLFGALFINTSWILGGAADGGWFMYAPNSSVRVLTDERHRHLGDRPGHHRRRLAVRRHQPDRDGAQHAHQGHVADAHAGVHVDDPRHPVPAAVRHPGDHRGPGAAHLPAPVRRHVLLRRGRRRPAAVAAPVLDLRPPRGVHPRAAVVRHRQRGAAGLLQEAAVRLPVRRLLRCGDRLRRLGRLGPPHVRLGPRAGERRRVLRRDDGDRHPDRRQDRQLDAHDVGRQA